MRKLLALLVATVLGAAGVQRAEAAVSVDFFFTALEPYGEWLETSDYGYVWQPRERVENWHPYTVGQWAYTDAGWTWVSEEPHGWATHHYGRWVLIESTGWVWVPDVEWAPAWVSWRRTTTYVGWAPLPPEARFERTVGIREWSDSYYDVGPTYYSFVETRNFGATNLATVIVPPQRNVTIIRESKNITNIVVRNNIIINEGPQYDVIVRESAQPVRRLRLDRRTDIAFDGRDVRRESLRTSVEGDVLRMPAPEVQLVAEGRELRPPRSARRLEKAEVNRGWKGLPQEAEVKELREKIVKESPKPEGLPPQPKFERLAERAKRGDAGKQPEAVTTTPGAEKPATEQPVVGTEGEMKRRGKQPGTAETPADATKPGATATKPEKTPKPGEVAKPDETKPVEPAKPGEPAVAEEGRPERGAAGRRARDMKQSGTATQPDSTTPATVVPGAEPTTTPETAKPGTAEETPATGREGRKMSEDAAKRTKQGATPEAKTPDARDRAKARQEAAGRTKTDAPDEPATPAAKPEREAADQQKTDAKMRRQEGDKQQQEAQSAAKKRSEATTSPATTTEPPGASEPKTPKADRPDRRAPANNRPDAPQHQQAPDRPERAVQPDRPSVSPGAERPERVERPERAQQPEKRQAPPGADRPARQERQERPQAGPGADRSGRGADGAPEAGRPSGSPGASARPGGGGGGARGERERAAGAGKKANGPGAQEE